LRDENLELQTLHRRCSARDLSALHPDDDRFPETGAVPLLWVSGRSGVLRRAERINFVEGAAWDEARAGTNAPGTALRLDTAVQIRVAEHFNRSV